MNKQEEALSTLKKFHDISPLKRYTEFCINPTDFQTEFGITPEFANSQKLRYAIEKAISALEKQIPKRPEEKILIREDNYKDGSNIPRYDWWCCNCHLETIGTDLTRYCPSCGQAIDWRNEDE